MSESPSLLIGTRGSPLALAQAEETRAGLAGALGCDPGRLALRTFTTTGDAIQDRALAEAGGKGLFTKELDAALLDGRIDLAVHSAKDLPASLPDGLVVAGYLPREDARDALISPVGASLADLPARTVVGTASPRRAAQVLRARPDLRIGLLRGNVGTRLRKIAEGEAGATLLALAGLKRLGREREAAAVLSPDEMLPAVGQGAIAIVARQRDETTCAAIARIADAETGAAVTLERAFLGVLDGSCRTPIAGYARAAGGRLVFRGLVLRLDGTDGREIEAAGPLADAERIGREAGHEIKARVPPDLFQA